MLKRRSAFGKAIGWVIVCLFILGVIGFLVLRSAVLSYLASEDFHRLISGKTSAALHVEGEFQPLRVNGTSIYSDGFKGTGEGPVSAINAAQVRADVSLGGVLEGEWRIEEVSLQSLDLILTPESARVLPPRRASADEGSGGGGGGSSWLPTRVVLEAVSAREFNLDWSNASGQAVKLHGSSAKAQSRGQEGWALEARGGKLSAGANLPEMDLDQFKGRLRGESLYVTEARLRHGEEGSVAISGELGSPTELNASLEGISVEPFLDDAWKARLSGRLHGDVSFKPVPSDGAKISGSLKLVGGELHGLSLLDHIASFTRTERFQRLVLTRAEADFSSERGVTNVQRFVAESEGLLKVEGDFVVQNGEISGSFNVGVTPASLQWLPGAQDKVFTVRQDGYLWTKMRVSGPLEKPKEDLSSRLAVAAGEAMFEGFGGASKALLKGVEGTVEEAPNTLLDLVPLPR